MRHAIKYRRTQLLSLLLTTAICCLPAVAESAQKVQKVSYEPKVVTLTGTIVPQVFPGPPNYKSVAEGDKPEKEWILHLQEPIQVDAYKDNDAERNVRELQLIMGFTKDKNADPA